MDKKVEEKQTSKINGKQKVKAVKEKKNKNTNEEKYRAEISTLNEKVLRLTAEIQNMRKRHDDEMSRVCKYDGEEIIKKILPVVDNFERAIKLDDSNLEDELSKFLSGFKMIYGNLLDILKMSEVTEINALNEPFDPTKMEAVLTAHEDGIDPGIVIDVMQKGYMYKDKVLRVAMVKVSE